LHIYFVINISAYECMADMFLPCICTIFWIKEISDYHRLSAALRQSLASLRSLRYLRGATRRGNLLV
jgi:hypothetical protein